MTKLNNEWVPEVGDTIGFKTKKNTDDGWRNFGKIYTGKVEFINEYGCVISGEWGWSFFDYEEDTLEFYPIKTEAEKRRDEQVDELAKLICSTSGGDPGSYLHYRSSAKSIIDAGWIKPKPLADDVMVKLVEMAIAEQPHRLYGQYIDALKLADSYIRGELDL